MAKELIGYVVSFFMGGIPFNMAFKDKLEAEKFAKEHKGRVWSKFIEKL